MRGSPLVQALILVAALALAGIPVWSLTRPEEKTPARVIRKAGSDRRTVELTVNSTTPAEASLTHEGKIVWQGAAAEGVPLELPAGAVELVAVVRWNSQPGSHAIRFQVSQDGDAIADVSLWGEAETTDVITLPASKTAAP